MSHVRVGGPLARREARIMHCLVVNHHQPQTERLKSTHDDSIIRKTNIPTRLRHPTHLCRKGRRRHQHHWYAPSTPKSDYHIKAKQRKRKEYYHNLRRFLHTSTSTSPNAIQLRPPPTLNQAAYWHARHTLQSAKTTTLLAEYALLKAHPANLPSTPTHAQNHQDTLPSLAEKTLTPFLTHAGRLTHLHLFGGPPSTTYAEAQSTPLLLPSADTDTAAADEAREAAGRELGALLPVLREALALFHKTRESGGDGDGDAVAVGVRRVLWRAVFGEWAEGDGDVEGGGLLGGGLPVAWDGRGAREGGVEGGDGMDSLRQIWRLVGLPDS